MEKKIILIHWNSQICIDIKIPSNSMYEVNMCENYFYLCREKPIN